MRTASQAHEQNERTDARERANSQAKQSKKEPDRHNRYEYPRPYRESGDDDDDWAGDGREQSEGRSRQRDAGDRAYTQAKEKEEREWSTEVQARLEPLLQSWIKIEMMKANIANMDQEDAEILESERRLKSRNAYRTSIWDQITEKAETEQATKRAERLQARAAAKIKLGWAEKDLEQRENDYKTFLSLQSRQRREQADKVEAALRATTKHTAQQEAKRKRAREKGIPERLAREKEEKSKEAEGKRREAEKQHEQRELAREEAKKAKLRETQKDEATKRQLLLEKIEKQKRETMSQQSRSPSSNGPKPNGNGPESSHIRRGESVFAASNTGKPRSSRVPQSRNHQPRFSPTPAYNPSTSSWRDREQSYASDSSEEGYCDHGDFWPKIQGGQECRNCARFCNAFIFRCPDCGILACASCRDQLRRRGS